MKLKDDLNLGWGKACCGLLALVVPFNVDPESHVQDVYNHSARPTPLGPIWPPDGEFPCNFSIKINSVRHKRC